jgi:hypothetical protein
MNSAIVFRGVTLVGLRPPGVPPRKRQHTTPTGRGSTYQGRKPVQTKPATALDTVNSIAHRLKSVAGNIGAHELAALFNDLEGNASAMQLREANTALRKIKIEFKRTAIALQHEMIT